MKKMLLVIAVVFSASLGLGVWAFTTFPKSSNDEPGDSSKNTDRGEDTVTEQEKEANMSTSETSGPRIYVSFASHNEDEFHPDYPNYIDDEATFWEHRANAIAYAEMLVSHGVKYDFQTDWNFLLAVQKYDQGDDSTSGKNILRYLHEDLGVDIDPHSHENGGYNFVDVAYLISQLGVEPTGVVGGFIAGPPEDSQLSYFWNLEQGEKYPNATWNPEILWGGGTGQHQNESDYWISGIWNPKNAEDFDVHDSQAALPNVGNFSGSWEGLNVLLDELNAGNLSEDSFYTATIMINQSGMDEATRNEYEANINELSDEVANGEIIFSTITNTYNTWLATQDGTPTIFHYTDTDAPTPNKKSDLSNTESPPTPSTSSPLPGKTETECGDGTCTLFEQKSNSCSADCN